MRGKIVLVEVEVPIDPDAEPGEFAKWRPYSFHQYKVRNARDHGAAGMLYHYPIANPNCLYIPDLVLTYVGPEVVHDIFRGSGRNYEQVVKSIRKTRRERSFASGKVMTLKNFSEHHAEGVGENVLALLPGGDPLLRNETILISAHLDHLGMNPFLTPGANDNASGVAVAMAVAQAMAGMEPRPRRSVAFLFFAAEEQGVKGSEYYLQHQPPALAAFGLLSIWTASAAAAGWKRWPLKIIPSCGNILPLPTENWCMPPSARPIFTTGPGPGWTPPVSCGPASPRFPSPPTAPRNCRTPSTTPAMTGPRS